jgi:hypothetical protein
MVIFPLKMVIFYSYVSLPEDKTIVHFKKWRTSDLSAVPGHRYRPVVMSRNLGQKMPSALWNLQFRRGSSDCGMPFLDDSLMIRG